MNPKDLKRLMDLMSKGVANLSAEEKTELTALQAKAAAVIENPEGNLSAEDVKKLVTDAVTEANKGALTADAVKSMVETAVKGIQIPAAVDQKALVEQVVKGIPTAPTAEDVKGIVEGVLKNIRPASKMVHEDPESSIELPIAHRAGNLSVAMKQVLNVMTKGADHINEGIPESLLKKAEENGARQEKRIEMLGRKALSTTAAGSGLEFMNVAVSTVILQRMYMECALANALLSQEVQMPSNPFTYPLSTTRPTFGLTAENGQAGEGTGGSANLVLNATKLTAKSEYSYEAEEDALIAILPQIINQLGDAAGEAFEDAIINGDTAGTQDTGTAANSRVKAFDGIRKLALAQAALKVSFATGGVSAANIGALRKVMKRWGLKPSDLILIAGTNAYNDLVLLPETLTAEKVGNAAAARILTGMAPSIYGIEIVPSAFAREDLNATGVFDNTTTTKGAIYLMWKPGFVVGTRRGFTLEQDKDTTAQKKWVVASYRRAFKPVEPLANVFSAAIGYGYNA